MPHDDPAKQRHACVLQPGLAFTLLIGWYLTLNCGRVDGAVREQSLGRPVG